MATPYGEKNFHTRNIQLFAEEVERLTDGSLKIETHSGGSLLPHGEIAQAVIDGEIQLGEVFQSTLSGREPIFGADGLPFLASTYAEAEALATIEKEYIARAMDDLGLIPLFSVPWPPQGLYSTVELTDPSEFEGASFRVNNDILTNFAESLVAEPIRLEVSELPDAFRSNRIDIMMTSASTGVSSQSWEYLGYYYDLQAWLPKNIVFVNREAFSALSSEEQQAVTEAADYARSNGWLMSQIEAVESVKVLFDSGMTIVTPGEALSDASSGGSMQSVEPAILERLDQAGEDVRNQWLESAGASGRSLLNAYEETNR